MGTLIRLYVSIGVTVGMIILAFYAYLTLFNENNSLLILTLVVMACIVWALDGWAMPPHRHRRE